MLMLMLMISWHSMIEYKFNGLYYPTKHFDICGNLSDWFFIDNIMLIKEISLYKSYVSNYIAQSIRS